MALYNQVYTFADGATASGDNVNSEIVALGASVNSIVDAQVDSSAAIAYSKLDLSTSILNADVNAAAAIDSSKLAISAGEGIDLSAGGVISGENASTSNKGIASFATADFTVSSGAVTIKDSGINHDATTNFVANEHIDWTGASSNLSTSGDITTSAGDVKAQANGKFYAYNAGNTHSLQMYHDSTNAYIYTTSGELYLDPAGNDVICNTGVAFRTLNSDISAKSGGDLYSYSAGDDKHIRMYHNDTDAIIEVDGGVLYMSNMASIRPTVDKSQDLGQASFAWNVIHYVTLTSHSLVELGDEIELLDGSKVSNVEAIENISEGTKKEKKYGKETGYKHYDKKSFPKSVYKEGKIAEKDYKKGDPVEGIENEKEVHKDYKAGEVIAEEGVDVNNLISLLIGSVRELSARVKELEK